MLKKSVINRYKVLQSVTEDFFGLSFISRFGRFGRAKAQSNLAARRFGRAMAVGLESDMTQAQGIGAMGGECGLVPAGSEITGGKHFAQHIKEVCGGPAMVLYEGPEFDDCAVQ